MDVFQAHKAEMLSIVIAIGAGAAYYLYITKKPKEVYATREKKRLYKPLDHSLLQQAEKKALTEIVEKLELDLDSKCKQLAELWELCCSRHLLSAKLINKLKRTEKMLKEVEHSLFDLEEKYRLMNPTIEEMKRLISKFLRFKKALVDSAIELGTELENATTEISSLFAKIDQNDRIEDGSRILIQNFLPKLTQPLEILCKGVAINISQQEQQLKYMEEDMQTFVHTKAKLFKQIASEANALPNDLQSGLHDQEEKIIVYAQKLLEAHCKTVEITRPICRLMTNFFKTLDMHATKLTKLVEEGQIINDTKSSDLEKKFEDCVAKEEQQLLEKVAAQLASLNYRKKEQVDRPTCSTPRNSHFNLLTVASIEELKTPAFEELLRTFWDFKSRKQENEDVKHIIPGAHDGLQSL